MADWSKAFVSGSREPDSIPVSAILVGFSALPTRKSTLVGNDHSLSYSCPYTRKKVAPLAVMCQRVKRQKSQQGVQKEDGCPGASARDHPDFAPVARDQ